MRHLDDLSHDELAVLVREYLLAGQLMDRAGMPHLISAYGRDEMADIAIDEWMGASPIYSMRMQRLLDFAAGDVSTIFKGMQFDIGAPPEFMDFRYKVIDPHHGEFWLDHCGALMDVEPMGDDYVTAMCHAIEDPTFDATAIATNRRAQVRPIHRPPRVPADRHPHCHWTVVIDDSHPELPLPEPMSHVERTLLAGIELPPLGAGAGDAELADGWNDYRAPVDPDLQTEQFSTAALRALAEEICVQQHLLVTSFCFAIERRHGTEDAVSVVERQFTGIAGLTSERLRAALGLGSDPADGPVTASLDEVATVLELHPAFRPRAYVDWRVRLADDGGALTVELGDCPALHEQGFETWISRLADGHDGGLVTAVQGVTPFGRVQRTGPRSWSVTLVDEPATEPSEVALTRFSTGADFTFVATPVTLAARRATTSS
ncbi:hypothetical protein [Dermatobacter hominis]|uniref:hypothetical protein n=1 Tax=Dermatobacter hominis TaxID=2884263 RepID=UPI001D11DAA1|nr:hypothetical protein [Dermatobacter hominis]UDY37397.1 hypothetical protein LH044_07610 [Dermatobacter hominis]